MTTLNNLQELMLIELQDLYSAETQILEALPQVSMAASSEELKQSLDQHMTQTEIHIERLQEIAGEMGAELEGKTCKATEGLLAEGQEILSAEGDRDTIDAALIGAQQKIEHYEIACYGTAVVHARQLGLTDAAQLLEETLQEEKQADAILTKLAESRINSEAMQ